MVLQLIQEKLLSLPILYVRGYRTASRYLAELARGKVLQESYVGKYHLYANKPLLKLRNHKEDATPVIG